MLYDKITELCHTLGIPVPDADEHGGYVFPFEGGLELHCSQHKGGIMLSAPVASVPDDKHMKDDMCRKMLQTSLGIMRKSPDVVAIDENTSSFIVYRRFIEDSYQSVRFPDAVEEFLNTLELIKNRVRQKTRRFAPPPMYGGMPQRY